MSESQQIPEAILRCTEQIPPLPDVVVKVIQLTRDQESNAKELTNVITQDPALTGNILRLCNSAYYGLPRVVSSLSQAIMYLGFYAVRNLVLTCSMRNFYESDRVIYGYNEGGLWFHSVASAITAELICEKLRPDLRDAAFTAALLHDIGQLIIAMSIKDTCDTILDIMEENNIPEYDAERQVVGISHDELGGVVADRWNYPDELIHAIRYHHKPSAAKSPSFLTSVVHLSDSICLQLGYGVEAESMKYQAYDEVLDTLAINRDSIDIFSEQAKLRVEERAPIFIESLNGAS